MASSELSNFSSSNYFASAVLTLWLSSTLFYVIFSDLFHIKVNLISVFYTRMINIDYWQKSMIKSIVAKVLPNSVMWRLRMFVLVGKSR